jgi:uncharacterized membrane protein (DUF4010 family)
VVALALGFLVGLERESAKIETHKLVLGGVRTYPIISMYGFGSAWLYQIGVTFMLPAGLLSLTVLAAIAYTAKIRTEHHGITSEVSALLTFVVGALALLVDIWIAMALGIVNAMLLSEKAKLESFVEKLDKVDFLAVLKFLLVTLIVLPVLPDQEFTRFKLNPASIWKLVILVSSIGFIGYALSKRFGSRVGLWLSGLLGGIVSSTAVTIAMGRMAHRDAGQAVYARQASILAGSVMYLRILAVVAVVSPAIVSLVWWKFVLLALVGALLSLSRKKIVGQSATRGVPGLQNPFEISPALLFAALFVLLTIATDLVKAYAGTAGVISLAAVVGVTDIDPFILSIVQGSDVGLIVSAILVAMMSNTLVKGIYFATLVPAGRKETLVRYGLWALLHLPLIFFS